MFKGLFGGRSQRHYARGIELFNEGLLVDAIASFEEAIEADADGPDAALARFYRAEAHARLGADLLEAGDHARALGHIDAALEEHAAFPDLHIQRALALLHGGDALAAERSARAALELNPEFVDAGAALVVALHGQGNRGRARELADQWAQVASARGDALAADFARSEQLLDALVRQRERRQRRKRVVERAESCLRDGFWADAARSLEPLVEETPDYPDLRLRLAAAYLGQARFAEAGEQLDRALERNRRFADAHVLSGIVALRLEMVNKARVHFDEAAGSGRVPLPAIYGQVLCDLRTGRFAEALAGMNRLAGEDAPPEAARVLHAILESFAGRQETAVERFEAVLTGVHDTEFLLDVLAWATAGQQLDLAHRALDRIVDDDRTRGDVVRAHARLRSREGALDRARQLLESALLDHPTDAGLLLDLAELLARAGEDEAGLRCLDALENGGERIAGAARVRAALLRHLGDVEAAREWIGRGREVCAPEEALELLFLARVADDGDRVRAIWADHAAIGAIDLRWRVQNPGRWLGPLRPWPASASRPHPTS